MSSVLQPYDFGNFYLSSHAFVWLNCKLELIMIFTMGWELSQLGCRKRGSNISQRRKEPQDDGKEIGGLQS